MIVVLLTAIPVAIVSALVEVDILRRDRRKAISYSFVVEVVYRPMPVISACGALGTHFKRAEFIFCHMVSATILRFVVPMLVALAVVPIFGLVYVFVVAVVEDRRMMQYWTGRCPV